MRVAIAINTIEIDSNKFAKGTVFIKHELDEYTFAVQQDDKGNTNWFEIKMPAKEIFREINYQNGF